MERIAVVGPHPSFITTRNTTGAKSAGASWLDAVRSTRVAETCDLFVPTASMIASPGLGGERGGDPIHILPLSSLPQRLAEGCYEVVHDLRHGHHLSHLSWLAGRHSSVRRVPVSAVHYALNFPDGVVGAMETMLYGVRGADTLVCLSSASLQAQGRLFDDVADQLRDIGLPTRPAPHLTCIPFGVDVDRFRPAQSSREKVQARRRLRIPQDSMVVAQVARFVAQDKADWEGCLRLGSALAGRGVTLVLAGADPFGFAAELRAAVQRSGLARNVRVLPDVDEIHLVYRAADVALLLCNSFQETQGLCVLEAMASGIPVLASNWDGTRDAIESGETGWLIPTRAAALRSRLWVDCLMGDVPGASLAGLELTSVDVEAAITILRDISDRKDILARMGQRARDYAVKHFGYTTMMGKYRDMWMSMIGLPTDPDQVRRPISADWGRLFAPAYASEATVSGETMISFEPDALPTAVFSVGTARRLDIGDRVLRALRECNGGRLACEDAIGKLSDRLGYTVEEAGVLLMWLISHGAALPDPVAAESVKVGRS